MHPFDLLDGPATHPCEQDGCNNTVEYDDEPYCFEHSPASGSTRRGYSYRRNHAKEN